MQITMDWVLVEGCNLVPLCSVSGSTFECHSLSVHLSIHSKASNH